MHGITFNPRGLPRFDRHKIRNEGKHGAACDHRGIVDIPPMLAGLASTVNGGDASANETIYVLVRPFSSLSNSI